MKIVKLIMVIVFVFVLNNNLHGYSWEVCQRKCPGQCVAVARVGEMDARDWHCQ